MERNPDKILASIQKEKEAEGRGKLKIFFGYAAGVGKTYAMLEAAHEALRRHVDVVIGYIEPHARPETAALVAGLPAVPVKTLHVNDIALHELDLDAVLQRHPELVLVDELAHTNAPGCRHKKRWQDVEELLAAGINVYTTVNVQHLESLNDSVAAITGVLVRERIPDFVFDRADQVELVDIEPAELLERMKRGSIYPEEAARQALIHFFTIGNLTALREIALRRCADRVNLRARENHTQAGSYPTDEHILVGLSSSPSNLKIIRTAAKMAQAFHAKFTALFVETPRYEAMSEENKARLEEGRHLAEQLGARIVTVHGDDVAEQIAAFAKVSGVSKIVVGRSATRQGWLRRSSFTEKLIGGAPHLDIYIIPDKVKVQSYKEENKKWFRLGSMADLGKSFGILVLVTLLAMALKSFGFADTDIVLLYIVSVLATAVITASEGCTLIASFLSVAVFNFFFIAPRFTLLAYDARYPMTFLVMFLTAWLTGSLASRLRAHAGESARTAYRMRLLFETEHELAQAEGGRAILTAAVRQLMKILQSDIILYTVQKGSGIKLPEVWHEGETVSISQPAKEQSVAAWVAKNDHRAGAGTDTLSAADCLYLPVSAGGTVFGVIAIPKERKITSFEMDLIMTILGECGLAMENDQNRSEKEMAAVKAKNEELRANLLRTISHDLRTPLTSICGNAGNLLSGSKQLTEETKERMYGDIYDDAEWLVNVVENLLSITRLDEGQIELHMSAEVMEDVVDEALRHVDRQAKDHVLSFTRPGEILLARMDSRLIVQVLINLVNNAVKYTPKGSHITISIHKKGAMIETSVADDGSGIPDSLKPRVFDRFASGTKRLADSRRSMGLGLALCRSIIQAHGGVIRVEDNHPHGAVFTFTLPAEEVTLHE